MNTAPLHEHQSRGARDLGRSSHGLAWAGDGCRPPSIPPAVMRLSLVNRPASRVLWRHSMALSASACDPCTVRADGYERRRPEETLLYRVVHEHWPPLRELAEEQGSMAAHLRRMFSQRLAILRHTAKLSQAELAECTHLSTEFISRLERGVTLPSLDTCREPMRCARLYS